MFSCLTRGGGFVKKLSVWGEGALKIRIYKNVTPLFIELQIYTFCRCWHFIFHSRLLTIMLVNNVTFCQTKRYNGSESMYT